MKWHFGFLICTMFSLISCAATAQPALKDVCKDHFLIGTALQPSQYSGWGTRRSELIASVFNSITPENEMKWEMLRPAPGRFDFASADRFVRFGERHGMFIVGHTLIWHSQTPAWVFQGENGKAVSREMLLDRMREHIHTVVGRYKGRVQGWDVVNEALNDDGTLRDSPWRQIIGDDYIVKAFQFAHQADPEAELYYNDYGIENRPKRQGAIRIIRQLQAEGVPVTAVGIQGHVNFEWPTSQLLDEAISAYAELGVRVSITELDVDVLPTRNGTGSVSADIARREAANPLLDPYSEGLPDPVQQQLADRYAELFKVYLKHSAVIDRVTFWGVTDGDSWLNDYPIRGRTAHPLLFDREAKPKPAYFALIEAASENSNATAEKGAKLASN